MRAFQTPLSPSSLPCSFSRPPPALVAQFPSSNSPSQHVQPGANLSKDVTGCRRAWEPMAQSTDAGVSQGTGSRGPAGHRDEDLLQRRCPVESQITQSLLLLSDEPTTPAIEPPTPGGQRSHPGASCLFLRSQAWLPLSSPLPLRPQLPKY